MNIYKFILLLIISLSLNASEQNLDKIKIQLQWKHQFEFAGFYAAIEKGYYKELGLDVELVPLDGKTDIVDEVLSGRAQYGISYSSIIAEYLNNKPIVFVANFFKQSPLVLVTQEHIRFLKQLKGAKIEGLSSDVNNITLHAMLAKHGIKNSDVKNISPTFSIDSFLKKEVDAIAVFKTNEIYLLDKAGAKYNVFDPISYGITYYDTNLFTSKKELLENPLRVRKIKEASIKGWKYALKHKEEMVELILKKYNTQNKSKDALVFEAEQVEQAMLPNIHEIGDIDTQRVEILAEDFIQSGFVKKDVKYNLNDFIFDAKPNLEPFDELELKYLKKKKSLKICVDPDWMPIEAIVNSTYRGIGSDYLKLFQNKIGIPISIYKTDSWSGSIEAMKQGKCDILSLSSSTQNRKEYFKFTDPFLELSLVVVTLADKKSIIDFSLLDGKSIAIVKGYELIERIRNKYPFINVVEVRNIEEGLTKVQNGEVFGFADSAVVIDYEYNNGSYDDFKVSAHFDEKVHLGYGVNIHNTQLHSILQKVVKSITTDEKKRIIKKWFTLNYKKNFDYLLVFQIAIVSIFIILVISYIYYVTRRSNKVLEKKVNDELERSKGKDRLIFHQNKLAAMGEMIENIAHQWRQPLSQVNSAVLIIDDVLDEKGIRDDVIEDKLLEIESLTKYMSNTIDDFRDYFNPNKVKESFVLENTLTNSIKILKAKIDSSNIKLDMNLENEHICFGYKNELQQALLAILNNAIDAVLSNNMKNPTITIAISRDSVYNNISICDNGGGISKDKEEKIFEPYYTTKHKTQGTGLGLYISKVIIEDSLSGKLNLKNSSDGACFTVSLKVKNEY